MKLSPLNGMRQFAAITLCLQLAISAVVAANEKTVTAYQAKQIITMNPQQPLATAVAIDGDKIIAVGDINSIKAALPGYKIKLDKRFAEQTIMPGFIDNHLHPTLAGILLPSVFITPFDWNLPKQQVAGVQSREEYLTRLKDSLAKNQDEIFITWGYHQYFHGELSRKDLDSLAPDRPVIVWHRSFHEVILNTQAMAALKLDKSKLSEIPTIDLDKGHFWELGLFAIFPNLTPHILNPERYQQGVLDGFLHAQQNGITTVADQGAPLFDWNMEFTQLNQVLSANQLPLDMYVVGNGKTLANDGLESGLKKLGALPAMSTEQVTILPKQVKLLADGAFYSQLMQMEDGYLDGHHGEWLTPPKELEQAMRAYWQADYQLHIHVNGDKGVNVVLGIIETLIKEKPRDHNTVLHHYGYSQAGHAERLAELGVSVSANPFYLWALADKYAEIGLGPDRAKYISRLGDLEKNGVAVSLHSDLPMAPASPLQLAGVAASRVTAAGTALTPKEKMSVTAALRAITIDAASAIQLADKIGSIETGKAADLVILPLNPMEVPPTEWANIKPTATIKSGVIY